MTKTWTPEEERQVEKLIGMVYVTWKAYLSYDPKTLK